MGAERGPPPTFSLLCIAVAFSVYVFVVAVVAVVFVAVVFGSCNPRLQSPPILGIIHQNNLIRGSSR